MNKYDAEIGLVLSSLIGNVQTGKSLTWVDAASVPDAHSREIVAILERLGGKQEGKSKKFSFPNTTPITKILQVCIDRQILPDRELSYSFATPAEVATQMWQKVHPKILKDKTARVLEPSAGTGSLLAPIGKGRFGAIVAIENNPIPFTYLEHNYGSRDDTQLVQGDFLRMIRWEEGFDLIIANPPLATESDKRVYLRHIWMMLEALKTGGQLVCLVPDELFSGTDKKVLSLRSHLNGAAEYKRVSPELMRGINVKSQFYIASYYKMGGKINPDSSNRSKHFKEASLAVRQRSRQKIGGGETVSTEPQEA